MGKLTPNRAFRFDRFQGHRKLAEGVLVHAESMEEAHAKAWRLCVADTGSIKFRDNAPCFGSCSICRAALEGET